MDISKLVMAGLGGFAGSICRYLVFDLSAKLFKAPFIPYGTLMVNVAGCLLIGFFGGLIESRALFSPEIRALILIGFLGGFTTYSTFGYELLLMLRQGQTAACLMHISLHLILGLIAVFSGFTLSRAM
jgi:CrcB protein